MLILLKALKKAGIATALASSSTRTSVEGKLRILGIGKFFDCIITASDVADHKPAPKIYLRTLERLSVASSNCIVIEDTIAGVSSAHAAGIRVVGFSKFTDDPEAITASELSVSDWSELSTSKLQALLNKPSNF